MGRQDQRDLVCFAVDLFSLRNLQPRNSATPPGCCSRIPMAVLVPTAAKWLTCDRQLRFNRVGGRNFAGLGRVLVPLRKGMQ